MFVGIWNHGKLFGALEVRRQSLCPGIPGSPHLNSSKLEKREEHALTGVPCNVIVEGKQRQIVLVLPASYKALIISQYCSASQSRLELQDLWVPIARCCHSRASTWPNVWWLHWCRHMALSLWTHKTHVCRSQCSQATRATHKAHVQIRRVDFAVWDDLVLCLSN